MSEAGRKRTKLGGGTIEYQGPVPNPDFAARRASVEADLGIFERHREALLDILREVYERGPNSEPFKAGETWSRLRSLAEVYLHREWVKQRATKPAERQAQLRHIATALARARDVLTDAKRSDVGNDLFSAWWDLDPKPLRKLFGDDDDLSNIVDVYVFDKAIALLAALETTARPQANEIPTRRGRPKGTANLPWDFIASLALIYRGSTGLKPGAGDGPFGRFVLEFLIALGRKYESLIDDIKDTRKWAQRSKWSSSPFDNSFSE